MNYYLKYKKYKNKYYLLKHGGSSPEITIRKRIESQEWSNAKWLVFVEAIFVLYGIRHIFEMKSIFIWLFKNLLGF